MQMRHLSDRRNETSSGMSAPLCVIDSRTMTYMLILSLTCNEHY